MTEKSFQTLMCKQVTTQLQKMSKNSKGWIEVHLGWQFPLQMETSSGILQLDCICFT